MSNTVSYDKDKLQTFIEAYGEMSGSITAYNEKINNFQEAIELLADGFSSDVRDPRQRLLQYFFFKSSDANTKYYMVTHENILIQLKNKPNDSTDRAKINIYTLDSESTTKLEDDNNKNTVVEITGTYGNDNKTVRAVYIDDNKFKNDSENNYWHVTNMMRYRSNNVQPNYWGMGLLMKRPLEQRYYQKGVHIMPEKKIFEHDGECDIESYQRCIMETVKDKNTQNIPMIGLHQNQNEKCECYDMTGRNVSNSIDYYEDEIYTSTNTVSDQMHYFGLFMDGRVMGLNKEVYKDNFDTFFTNNNNENLVDSGIPYMNQKHRQSLNPFVGHGMHAFEIKKIESNS